jgi:arsenate reductase
MNVVLFACIHNAGRSQLAAAWFNRLADPARARAISAGTQPAPAVHPEVRRLMEQEGLAPSPPRLLTPELASTASLLVTMGCGEACPAVPGVTREDWPLRDPKGLPAAEVEAVSRDVRARVDDLIARRGWSAG